MKTFFKVLGVLFVIIVIGAIASSGKKDSNTDTTGSQSTPAAGGTQQTQASASATPQAAEITLSNATYKDSGYGTYEVDGEAKNNDSIKHTMTLKATFYDANGGILGTAEGAVNDLAPGDTKTYTLVGTDKVSGYANMKVQVDTLF